MHIVLVHNLGHREIFLRLQGERELRKPTSTAQHSLGRDLWMQLESTSDMMLETPGEVTLAPPAAVGWAEKNLRRRLLDCHENGPENAEGLVQSVAFPLIESAVQAVMQQHADNITQLEIVLVSSGPSVVSDVKHPGLGGSTEGIAKIVQKYAQIRWPRTNVSIEHRDTD